MLVCYVVYCVCCNTLMTNLTDSRHLKKVNITICKEGEMKRDNDETNIELITFLPYSRVYHTNEH